MEKSLDSLLKEMTHQDIILALILEKPGNSKFKEEALAYGLRKVSGKYPRLASLFHGTCDGSPEHSSSFDNVLAFASMVHTLEVTGDWQFMYMPKSEKQDVREELRKEYGDGISDSLKEFVKEVWEAAETYSPYV